VALIVETRAVAPFHKNGYLAACGSTREAILIDPGDEVDDLLRVVEKRDLSVSLILLTHAHVDHVSGVGRAKRATGARVGVHGGDAYLYDAAVQQGLAFGYRLEQPPPPDIDLAECPRSPSAPVRSRSITHGPQSGRGLPARHRAGRGGDPPLRGRHAVCGIDRTN